MKYICLSPRTLDTPEKMHAYLKTELGFPDYYGMNLDALFDVMSTYPEQVRILYLRYEKDGRSLFPQADLFFFVLRDAAQENDRLLVDEQTLEAL